MEEKKEEEVQQEGAQNKAEEDKPKDAKRKPSLWWLAGDGFGYLLPVTS